MITLQREQIWLLGLKHYLYIFFWTMFWFESEVIILKLLRVLFFLLFIQVLWMEQVIILKFHLSIIWHKLVDLVLLLCSLTVKVSSEHFRFVKIKLHVLVLIILSGAELYLFHSLISSCCFDRMGIAKAFLSDCFPRHKHWLTSLHLVQVAWHYLFGLIQFFIVTVYISLTLWITLTMKMWWNAVRWVNVWNVDMSLS